MSLARTTTVNAYAIGERYGFEREKVELIKSQIAQGASDGELALFLYTAQRVGLDPLARQIYCIMRKDRGVEKMTIQTGIDGYRLIADRTGNYAPGRANTFEYDDSGKVVSATAYVMKYVRGTWLEVSATAYWDEYVATFRDGNPMGLWGTKPRVMLGKCAEALALRRAFPAELSGIYTAEEMNTEVNPDGGVITVLPPTPQPQILDDTKRQKIMDRIGVLIGELLALDPAYQPERFDQYNEADLISYGKEISNQIAALHEEHTQDTTAEEQTADVQPSNAEIAFWARWGGYVGGTTLDHIHRAIGPFQVPATDEDWTALDDRMEVYAEAEAARYEAGE